MFSKPYVAPKLNQSQQFTCFSCPNFENFNGERGRGLCKYHDQVVFEHHESTAECIYALEKKSNQHLQSYELPEDIPYSEFEPGQKVKVIDEGEDHTEWSSFVVVTKIINPNRFSSITSYQVSSRQGIGCRVSGLGINSSLHPTPEHLHPSYLEPDWYYLIASLDRPNTNMFWVAEDEICHINQSHLIDTSEPF